MTHRISIGQAFSHGWKTFAKRPLFFVGVLFLLFFVTLVIQMPGLVLDLVTPDTLENADAAGVSVLLLGAWGAIVFALLSWVVQQYLSIGVIRITLDAVSGRPYSLKSLLLDPMVFVNVLLASIVAGALAFLGFLALIIPGIYISLALSPVVYVILDQKVGPIDAVQRCWHLTKGNRGWLFLFGLASFGINVLGILALGVGLLVTVPFTWLAMADVYRQLAEKKA